MKSSILAGLLMGLLGLGLGHPSLYGQGYRGRHPFDFNSFNLGMQIGTAYNTYNLKQQINVVDQGIRLKEIDRVVPRPGLSLAMIANFRLDKKGFINFRFIPGFSLEQRNLEFVFEGSNQADSLVSKKIEASYFNFPFLMQVTTAYHQAVRLYLVGGMQVGINPGSNKKVQDDRNLLKVAKGDMGLVFAIGMNLYGDRIKLSPEIRYTLGILNIYEPENTNHSAAISHLSNQGLTFCINLE